MMRNQKELLTEKKAAGEYKVMLLVLLLGALMFGLADFAVFKSEDAVKLSEFSQKVHSRTIMMRQNLGKTLEIVNFVHTLFDASSDLDRASFDNFVSSEMAFHPNVQTVEWIPRVALAERNSFEAKARRDGPENFTITELSPTGAIVPARERKEYFPVYYAYPMKGNESVLGFDLASDPTRLATLKKAGDSGQIQITQRITLVQGTGRHYGVLLFQPHYKGGEVPQSLAERRAKLLGFALGVIRISDVFQGSVELEGVQSFVFDSLASQGKQILFPRKTNIQGPNDPSLENCLKMPVKLKNVSWTAIHCRIEASHYISDHLLSMVIAIAGLLITLIGMAFSRNIYRQKCAAAEFTENIKASEMRYRDLVDHTNVLIQSVETKTGLLSFVNNGWKDIMGYNDAEIATLNITDILDPGQLGYCRNIIKTARQTGKAQDMETIFRRKDGTWLNVEGHIICRKDGTEAAKAHGVFTDVTERRKAEEEIIRSEERYSGIVELASQAIISINVNSIISSFNAGASEIFGYPPEEIIGQSIDILIPDRFIKNHAKYIKKFSEDSADHRRMNARSEIVGRRKNGEEFTAEASISKLFLTEGAVYSVILEDITERTALAQENARIANDLTQLIYAANAPIFGIDADRKVNEWNHRAEQITGYKKEEVIGKNLVNEFIADDYKKSVAEILDKALLGTETENFDFPLVTKSGKFVDILLNSTIRRDAHGNINGVVGVGQDNTERNQINAEREHLTQAIENLKESLVLFDQEDRLIFCNEAFRVLNAGIIEFTKPGTLFEDYLRAGTKAGIMTDGIGRLEAWIVQRNAKDRFSKTPIEVVRDNGVTLLINEQKLPNIGWIQVISDITQLKQSQAQVIQASKLATLGEMATSVAHELNQPLNVIRMAAGNSRRKLSNGTADPEYLNEKLERIEGQTIRAAAIIDHMRMFGRKAEEKPGELDPREIITNALNLMGEQLRLAGIDIVTEFPDTCSLIMGHTIQMEQVILNLLTNARDAMADMEGGAKIIMGVHEDDAGVHLTSHDTGNGIPQEVLHRIFEPFYTTKEMGKGTGLGLSVSYGIVREMGGSIVADNVDGSAHFTITVPAVSK